MNQHSNDTRIIKAQTMHGFAPMQALAEKKYVERHLTSFLKQKCSKQRVVTGVCLLHEVLSTRFTGRFWSSRYFAATLGVNVQVQPSRLTIIDFLSLEIVSESDGGRPMPKSVGDGTPHSTG